MTVKHILFDCDNTLVLSEHLAFEACAGLVNEILAHHKVNAQFTPNQLMTEFVGMNFRGMVVALRDKHGFALPDAELEAFVKEEEERVIALLKEKLQPCIGVDDVLAKLYNDKKYGLAVVSSSALRRVRASLEKVNQEKYFPHDHVFSAATSLPVPTSKPNPAIYIHAAQVIGVKPEECVAVEDSKSGTLSAVRAGIPVMAYVGSCEPEKQKELAQTLTDAGAKVVMYNWTEFESLLGKF
ncbi:haloacid dehalogenase-like hydrolase family protein [Gaertneriomyces semiglobifer]|nr:haloacid dehalogenase-like hydrolase family protein [Gaertneriomyces semiglobifer]